MYARNPGSIRRLAAEMAAGSLTSQALVQRCLDRIAEVDGAVQAWRLVLAEQALASAAEKDAERRAGLPCGPLHGIPFGVKDVIDLAGHVTRANSRSRESALPATADATVVAALKAAGAVLLGKLHTTEYAWYSSIPPTRNPYDLSRTPGGSSAGSGAAVAAGTVPMALGTQTAGSVNRPAAYTGVGAFKPSTLAVGGAGVVPLAPSFDTVGAFGATAADAALLAAGYAPAALGLPGTAPTAPRMVLLRHALPVAPHAEAAVQALGARLQAAGVPLRHAPAPVPLAEVAALHRVVLLAEVGRTHARLPPELLDPGLAADIATGQAIPAAEYLAALAGLARLRGRFWAGFAPGEMLLLPAAPDVAPNDGTTGDPSFVIPLTALCGPVATLRAGLHQGLPLGALLTMAPGQDAALAGFLLGATGTELEL